MNMHNQRRAAQFSVAPNGVRCLLTLLASLAASLPARADWVTEPVYTGGESGFSLFLDLDSAGTPHAAYNLSGDLEYAVRSSTEWDALGIVDVGETFALDHDDRPFFGSRPGPNFDLEFQLRLPNGLLLGDLIAPSPVAQNVWLDFDSQNRPHVGFIETATSALRHARWTGTEWDVRTVAVRSGFQFANADFVAALDASDEVHFAWGGFLDFTEYARPSRDGWLVGTVPGAFDAGVDDIEVDNAGNAHLAFDQFDEGLSYGLYNGSTWLTEAIPNLEGFGNAQAKLVLDSAGSPHLVTFDRAFGGPDLVKHIFRDGETWSSTLIDSIQSSVSGPEAIAAAVNSAGIHAIYSADDRNVYYAFLDMRVPGDYDGNGSVGPEDYALWVDTFGSTSNPAADGNGNGVIDAGDYTVWRDHRSAGDDAGRAATAVPEPLSIWLAQTAGLALVGLTAARRRSGR